MLTQMPGTGQAEDIQDHILPSLKCVQGSEGFRHKKTAMVNDSALFYSLFREKPEHM